jgi:hypothetical protein
VDRARLGVDQLPHAGQLEIAPLREKDDLVRRIGGEACGQVLELPGHVLVEEEDFHAPGPRAAAIAAPFGFALTGT